MLQMECMIVGTQIRDYGFIGEYSKTGGALELQFKNNG